MKPDENAHQSAKPIGKQSYPAGGIDGISHLSPSFSPPHEGDIITRIKRDTQGRRSSRSTRSTATFVPTEIVRFLREGEKTGRRNRENKDRKRERHWSSEKRSHASGDNIWSHWTLVKIARDIDPLRLILRFFTVLRRFCRDVVSVIVIVVNGQTNISRLLPQHNSSTTHYRTVTSLHRERLACQDQQNQRGVFVAWS